MSRQLIAGPLLMAEVTTQGANCTSGAILGFSILLKDTTTCSSVPAQGSLGFKPATFQSLVHQLYPLSYSCPSFWIVNLKKFEQFVLLRTRTCVWTYLSFEVVLPLLRLQSFEASAAVGRDRHAEGPVSSGGELGGEGHGDGPRIVVIAPTHHQIWTGAWVKREDMCEINRMFLMNK